LKSAIAQTSVLSNGFFACQSFQVNLFYAEKRPPQNIRFCAQPHCFSGHCFSGAPADLRK